MNWKQKTEGSPENLPENGNEGYTHENTCPQCGEVISGYLPWHLANECEE